MVRLSAIAIIATTIVVLSCIVSSVSACGGTLGAIYHINSSSTPDDCAYINIECDGTTTTRSMVPQLCADVNPALGGMPMTHFGLGTDRLFFTSGTGKYVWAVNVFTGDVDTAPYAVLPATYDFIIGLAYTVNAFWVVTTSTIYVLKTAPGTVTKAFDISSYSLTSNAVMTNSDDSLFFADGPLLVQFNLAKGFAVSKQMSPVKKPMDLQWYGMNSTLLIVDTYRLFAVDPVTAIGTQVMAVPNGPGFPRVNTLMDTTWQFCDFVRLYTVDLQAPGGPNVTVVALWNSIPLVGYFQYFY